MAKNEFLVERVAVGNFQMPISSSVSNNGTIALNAGVYIPSGAIVNEIKYLAKGATNASSLSAGTINAVVGTVALGTNNIVASNAIVTNTAVSQAVIGGGLYIPTGGDLMINVGSGGGDRRSITVDCNVYVKYLK